MLYSNLGAGKVSVLGDFFLLGGDSLRAGRCIAALRKEFGVEVKVICGYTVYTQAIHLAFTEDPASALSNACKGQLAKTASVCLALMTLSFSLPWNVSRGQEWTSKKHVDH